MVQDLPLALCVHSVNSVAWRQAGETAPEQALIVPAAASPRLPDRPHTQWTNCCWHLWQFAAAIVLLLLAITFTWPALARTDPAFAKGYFTTAQAQAGQATFDQTCALCHGNKLQGKVGPALAGQQFLSVSQFQKVTAYYFYHFMSKHMPLNAPGSLTKPQYLDLLAYLLQVNGYASGSHQLSADSAELKSIKIKPQH